MNHHRTKIIAAFGAMALGFAPASFGGGTKQQHEQQTTAQSGESSSQIHHPSSSDMDHMSAGSGSKSHSGSATMAASAGGGLQLADQGYEERSLDAYQGRELRGTGGEKLGKINDLLVDTQSGKISFAVVSTGGVLGIGDELRLVPFEKLSPEGDTFTADLDQASFESLQTVQEDQLSAGQWEGQQVAQADAQMSEDSEQNRQSASQQNQSEETTRADASASSQVAQSGQGSSSHVRASQLEGTAIRSGENEVGSIEAIVIDAQNAQAQAVVDVNDDFAATSGQVIVPFERLQIGSDRAEEITTTLSQTDFAQFQPEQNVQTAGSLGMESNEDALPPTGRVVGATAGGNYVSGDAIDETDTAANADNKPESTIGDIDTNNESASTAVASSDTAAQDPWFKKDDVKNPSRADEGAMDNNTTIAGTTPTSPESEIDTSRVGDQQLSPTGATSAEQNPYSNADPALTAAATAVRNALDNAEQLSRENVQVTPGDDEIVLRGSVSSDDAKDRIESLAKDTAGEVDVNSELEVNER